MQRPSDSKAIQDMDVMPSARCLWTAGPALERDPSQDLTARMSRWITHAI